MSHQPITKLLVCVSILISAILVLTSIIKDCIARKYYSDYKKVLMGESGDIEKQKYYLKTALDFSPSNANTLFELGRSYEKEKLRGRSIEDKNRSYGLAKEFFNKALKCKPTDGSNYALYAWYIGNNGETNEAIEYFEKAIKLGITRAYIHRQYARWCVSIVARKLLLNSTRQFEGVYKNEKKKSEILRSYDEQLINGVSITAFLEKAQTEWDKALSLGTPTNRVARNSLADLYLLRCELDKAIANYKSAGNKIMLAKCYLTKEDNGNAVSVLGTIVKEGGGSFRQNKIQARKLLKDIIKRDPKNYLAFNWLGELYARNGRNRQAIVNLKRTVELDPKYTDAHLKLGRLYKLTGQSELAIYEYEIVLSLVPNHKEATFLLSEAIREKYKDAEFMIK